MSGETAPRDGLGRLVRAKRQQLGLTTKALGELIGVHQAYISKIEGGNTRVPGVELRRKLASALGTTNIELLIAAGELSLDDIGHGMVTAAPDIPAPSRELAQVISEMHPDDRNAVGIVVRQLNLARGLTGDPMATLDALEAAEASG